MSPLGSEFGARGREVVDAGAIARAHPAARDLPAKIREARVEALAHWKKNERPAASA